MHEPVLYIILRNDIESMTPGKACAQASHITNAFEQFVKQNNYEHLVAEWRLATGNFGKCVVLKGTPEQINSVVEISKNIEDMNTDEIVFGNTVIDPSYPVKDGNITHLVKIMTGAYIFVTSKRDFHFNHLRRLELYK